MAKGNMSTTKGKGTTRMKAPLKKQAPKKVPPKKVPTKKKGPQKRAAPDSSSEESDDEPESESDHRPRKRRRAKKDSSDSDSEVQVVENKEPEEVHETAANEGGHNSPNDSEVRTFYQSAIQNVNEYKGRRAPRSPPWNHPLHSPYPKGPGKGP
jgi:hypothetical protein